MMRWSFVIAVLALLAGACSSPGTTPSALGVRLSIDTSYYEATGATPREWLNSARLAAAPAGVRPPYLAITRWSTRWSSTAVRSTGIGCEYQNPQVVLEVKFIMPRLVADSAAAPEDRLEWQRFSQSLWRHEEGHALRGMRAASEMRDSLVRVHDQECASLSRLATTAVRAVSDKYVKLQAQYDDASQHGARQGAMLLPARGVRIAIDTTFRDTLP